MDSTSMSGQPAPSVSTSATEEPAGEGEPLRPLVMQIIVDRAILKSAEWTRGALVAQGAHAAIAVITETLDEPATREYVDPVRLGSMHKVVLQGPKKGSLAELSEKLKAAERAEAEARAAAPKEDEAVVGMAFPKHHLWIEQPENVPTAIAIAPNRRPPALKKLLDKCSLLQD